MPRRQTGRGAEGSDPDMTQTANASVFSLGYIYYEQMYRNDEEGFSDTTTKSVWWEQRNPRKLSSRTADIQTENRIQKLPQTKQQRQIRKGQGRSSANRSLLLFAHMISSTVNLMGGAVERGQLWRTRRTRSYVPYSVTENTFQNYVKNCLRCSSG